MVGRVFAGLLAAAAAAAQSPAPGLPDRELAVGVFEAPPYAMKNAKGEWHGFTVDLWKAVAAELQARYRFVEGTEDDTLQGLAGERLDVAAGPIAITMERERTIDFTETYLSSALSVAVRRQNRLERVTDLFRTLATSGAVSILVGIVALSAIFGAGIWLVERRRNAQFPARPAAGIGSGLWWAGVTTSGVGYGDKVPVTLGGRILAAVWMAVSIVLMVLVTASLTATLAVGEFRRVRDIESLRKTAVGALEGSAAADFLRRNQVPHRLYSSYPKVIEALAARNVEAVMFNEEILRYYADRAAGSQLQLLPPIFMPEDFAFPLVDGSPLRVPIDRALRRVLAEPRYRDLKDQYLYGDAALSVATP